MFDYVTIELNRNCNRSCFYCPVSKYKKISDESMSKKLFIKILKDLRKLNYKGSIIFSGYCEPLLDPNFDLYLTLTRKLFRKSKIIVYTNGDYLDNDKFNIIKKNDVVLILTFHSPEDKKHSSNLITLLGNYKKLIIKNNIENSFLSNRGGLVKVPKKERKKICINPSINFTIDYEGNAVICSHDFFSKNTYGNLNINSISEIWNSNKYKSDRKSLLRKVGNNGICKHCLK